MSGTVRSARFLTCIGGITLALALGACGGDDEDEASTEPATVGDCVDAEDNVVDCSSSEATHELVSDQSEPDAIACVTIGDKPQVEVTIGDTTFCAEEL
jgi:hypothetical protein